MTFDGRELLHQFMNFPQKLFILLQILLNCQIEPMTSTPDEWQSGMFANSLISATIIRDNE